MLTNQEVAVVKRDLEKGAESRLPIIFQALADETRLKIFRLFTDRQDLCVTDISNVLNISLPAVSYQLKIMEMVGLVEKERMGKMICYRLRQKDSLVKTLKKLITHSVEDNKA